MAVIPMSQQQNTNFAKRAGIDYPTMNGSDLYRICAAIPRDRREAFESGLGEAISAFYEEIARQGNEPPEPSADPVEAFVRTGLLSAEELFAGYEQARQAGQAAKFLTALKERNYKAAVLLRDWIHGNRVAGTAFVPKVV